jgi:adenosylcobinamide kinase/adenosylcobinamide-phosphate guanylyltransferase
VEVPLDLASGLNDLDDCGAATLVDSLTVWLGNLLHHNVDVAAAQRALVTQLGKTRGKIVVVASEVGLGIIPANAAAREFADVAGQLNQALAASAHTVVAVMGGLPLALKGQLNGPG